MHQKRSRKVCNNVKTYGITPSGYLTVRFNMNILITHRFTTACTLLSPFSSSFSQSQVFFGLASFPLLFLHFLLMFLAAFLSSGPSLGSPSCHEPSSSPSVLSSNEHLYCRFKVASAVFCIFVVIDFAAFQCTCFQFAQTLIVADHKAYLLVARSQKMNAASLTC